MPGRREVTLRSRAVALHMLLRLRRWLRSSEAALVVVALAVGAAAGLTTALQSVMAHGLQHLFYGVGINRLSALASIRHPLRLLALPAGGLILAVINWRLALARAPVDVVEANALHGGRLPLGDSLIVSAQTLISNGFGASVGLEAAYAQAGGCLASLGGRWVGLRRADMRILVGAGAGAAIGAAFGAPLTGAFYGFEIVIGAYTPAAIAPVAAAALTAKLVTRALGIEPWLIAAPEHNPITTLTYLVAAVLGLVAGMVGVGIMRAQTAAERLIKSLPLAGWGPVVGGVLLMPVVWASPQALSAGHGAMHLDMALHPAIDFLMAVFALKVVASIISLSFGFRGGLFFASLFLGSLLGPICMHGLNLAAFGVLGTGPLFDEQGAALIGMAALAVTIVGGPMTLSLLALEVTHDFALTGLVLTASVCASTFTRATFGYSFSTWRLHLRGTAIRSPRDIGWSTMLTAGRLMRRAPPVVLSSLNISGFREAVPLGTTSRVLLADAQGQYGGMVLTAEAYDPRLDGDAALTDLARLRDQTLVPDDGIETILNRFERLQVDDIAVTDAEGHILGLLTEKYVRRRYAEEIEKTQSNLYGEQTRGRP